MRRPAYAKRRRPRGAKPQPPGNRKGASRTQVSVERFLYFARKWIRDGTRSKEAVLAIIDRGELLSLWTGDLPEEVVDFVRREVERM